MRHTFLAGVTGCLMASAAIAQTESIPVDHGVDACPAFDLIQQRILEVTRGTVQPGSDIVAPEGDAPVAVEFILDASGSMGAQSGGRQKMQIALEAFEAALGELQHHGNRVASCLWVRHLSGPHRRGVLPQYRNGLRLCRRGWHLRSRRGGA